MCVQCNVKAQCYNEVIPNVFLIRATRNEYNPPQPGDMRQGEWALVLVGCSGDAFVSWDDTEDPDDRYYCDPTYGYRFAKSCKEAGWDERGYLASWFNEKLDEHLNKPENQELLAKFDKACELSNSTEPLVIEDLNYYYCGERLTYEVDKKHWWDTEGRAEFNGSEE